MTRTAPEILARASALTDAALDRALPREDDAPAEVHRAMRYSVFSGGKRLRPALAIAAVEALGHPAERALPSACAVELVHAFSLIHDDLPAMDDDDLRRGRPTNHKVFGEATAILAGDALCVVAFEVLVRDTPDRAVAADLALELARASGTRGMIGGQILDLAAERRAPDAETVDRIHRLKTAALIRAACELPALAVRAAADAAARLREYGELLGRAFQIADDVLDETSTPAEMGKGTQKDQSRGKMTYPAAVGLERSRAAAQEFAEAAVAVVRPIDRAGELATLARFTVERTR
ncbi:MAG TPA: farnesyl diphosphate synthase [Planctomycetota bacterium]|nr:farnesyl diphosphate synthase [Planctomycetota bacterium]